MLLVQIMHNYLMWQLRSLLARAPVRRTFQSETANRRRQLSGIYVLCACTNKEPQGPPEHTSEHVKSQNFLGACPHTPLKQSILWGPHFLYLPWAPRILLAALLSCSLPYYSFMLRDEISEGHSQFCLLVLITHTSCVTIGRCNGSKPLILKVSESFVSLSKKEQ